MPEFTFKARDRQGTLVEGHLSCPDRSSAILRIEREHGIPVLVKAVPVRSSKASLPSNESVSTRKLVSPEAEVRSDLDSSLRLRPAEQLFLTKQLAKLLKSGMTLEKALETLSSQAASSKLKEVAGAIHRDLTEGSRFSEALEKFPRSFSRIFISLVAAGESSGSLPLILKRLATYQEQNRKLLNSVKMALVYPLVLCLFGFVVIAFFVSWVVPQLMEFLESTGSSMPLITRLLIETYNFAFAWWWAFLLGVLAILIGFRSWVTTAAGALSWDRLLLKMPLAGKLIWTRFSAQAAMTLGTLLGQGVLLSRALELIQEIGGNRELALRMGETIRKVEDGSSLSAAGEETQLFPPLFLQMLQVGERSGELSDSLEGIAEHYEEEVTIQAGLISTLVPVIVIVAIAGVIGTIVIAIFMAVLNVASGLRRSISGLECLFDLPWV